MSSRKSFSRLTWFRKQRKAVVSANDKKMPNGILEEQEQQRVMLLSRSPSGPKKYFPIPVAHLEEEIRVRLADDCKRFREEFNVPHFMHSHVPSVSWKEELRADQAQPSLQLPGRGTQVPRASQPASTTLGGGLGSGPVSGTLQLHMRLRQRLREQHVLSSFTCRWHHGRGRAFHEEASRAGMGGDTAR